MQISTLAKLYIFIDRHADYVPLASTVTSLIDIFQKVAIQTFKPIENPSSHYYYSYLNKKSFKRCSILLIPVLGNIVVAILDFAQQRCKDPSYERRNSHKNSIHAKNSSTKNCQKIKTKNITPLPINSAKETVLFSNQIQAPVISKLADQLEMFIDNEGILDSNYCQQQTCDKLNRIFDKQLHKIRELEKEAFTILKTSNDSEQYSVCLSSAEKEVESIKNIISALHRKKASNSTHHKKFKKTEKTLQDMRSSIPLGNSIILRKDVEMMQIISSVPQEKTYISSAHGTFYEPQISLVALSGWFHNHIIEECYKGVSIARKRDCMYSHQLNTMCTIIGLKKKKNKGEEEVIQNHSSSRKSIKGSTSKADKQEMEHPSISWSKVSISRGSAWGGNMLRHSKEKSLEEVKALQENVLAEISKELPKMLAQWKYEKWEIGTSEDLITKYGVSPSIAREADYIILFHKKCE
jgi:hypothetical protein